MQTRQCVDCEEPATLYSTRCLLHHDLHLTRQGRSNWPLSRKLLWVGFGVFVTVLVYFVVQEFQPKEVTLEEYASVVCGGEGLDRNATWGEVRSLLQDRLADIKGLKPPADIVSFHEGRIAGLEGMVKVLGSKDGNSRMNEFELLGNPDAWAAMQADKAGARSLSPEARQVLRKHGCDLAR